MTLTDQLKYYQTNQQTLQEYLMWYDVFTRQNYFTHKHDISSLCDNLAMGASSVLIAELLLKHKENAHLTRQKHKIVNYFRYVDDGYSPDVCFQPHRYPSNPNGLQNFTPEFEIHRRN